MNKNPVVVDPNASPTITAGQASSLDSQINTTDKPIFVVFFDNRQVGKASGSELLGSLHNAHGLNTEEVLGIVTSQGFFAKGFNVPQEVADGAASAASKHGSNRNNVYQTISGWINDVANIHVSHSSPSVAQSNSHNSSKGKTIVIVFACLIGCVLLVIIGVLLVKRSKNAKNIKAIRIDIDTLAGNYSTIGSAALSNSNAQRDYDDGLGEITAASKALEIKDPEAARRHITAAQGKLRRINTWLKGGNPDVAAAAQPQRSTPRAPRVTRMNTQPTGTSANFRGPNGVTVNVVNTPMPQSQAYPHFYGGGTLGGVYYPRGYYATPFWESDYALLEGMIIGEQLGEMERLEELREQRIDYPSGFGNSDPVVPSGPTGGTDWDNGPAQADNWGDGNVAAGPTGSVDWTDDSSGSSDTPDTGNSSSDWGGDTGSSRNDDSPDNNDW